MKITLLCDTPDSYIHEHIDEIKKIIRRKKHKVVFVKNKKYIKRGDILFLLACSSILSKKELSKNKKNIVIHPSKLPKNKGSAALIWSVLKGEKKFYLTMFEADSKVDSGEIYQQSYFRLKGHELSDEIRFFQAKTTLLMIKKFFNNKKNRKFKQKGKSNFLKRRSPQDSELDINLPIKKQFNLLRVVDNKRYPAFFIHKKKKYILKIYKG
tara:strand:- start:3805 stop:4437 length:633 start_codon:yes stop_codon:yes gene_type:complete